MIEILFVIVGLVFVFFGLLTVMYLAVKLSSVWIDFMEDLWDGIAKRWK